MEFIVMHRGLIVIGALEISCHVDDDDNDAAAELVSLIQVLRYCWLSNTKSIRPADALGY